MSIRNIIFNRVLRGWIAAGLVLVLFFAQSAFAFDCLSPKIKIEQLEVEKEFERNIFLRNAIQKNLTYVQIGACRTISLNLAALLYVDGYKAKIIVDENHVWLEIDDYILDASMRTNAKCEMLVRKEPSLYAEWKNSGGVIRKDSILAKRLFYGAAIKIDSSEFIKMLENGMPFHQAYPPVSLVTKINQIFAMIQDEKRMKTIDEEIGQRPEQQAYTENPIIKSPVLSKYSLGIDSNSLLTKQSI